MNATEQARRSDALYYSVDAGINRRWLCDKVASLEAENIKLRELCKELAEFLTEAEWLQWPELRAEMQRMGVEVDG